MAVISYTAKRSIAANRELNKVYKFEIPLTQFKRVSKRAHNTATSLSGAKQVLLHRIDYNYQCSTIPVNDASMITQMREFLDSVAGGETFYMDGLGSLSSPDNTQSFTIDGDYDEQLIDITGYYQFSFGCNVV